jgi:predicted DNA-binding helix-hairpin-helix protein
MVMDGYEKLALVASATEFESDGPPPCSPNRRSLHPEPAAYAPTPGTSHIPISVSKGHVSAGGHDIPIHMAAGPNGKRIPLLKAMLTTACEMNCHYCAFHSSRDYRRVTFKPEELANIFHSIHKSGCVEGLFLSTGICGGGANTQNRLIDAAEILRHRLGYRGYLHLKIMPGAERDQVLRAMQLADRISINLEAPNPARLAFLAPRKEFYEQLLVPFQWMEEIRQKMPPPEAWNHRWSSSTTQFVVGPAGETDLELMSIVAHLTRSPGFARAYFEAFKPVPGTPLENHPPEDLLRQHRLYQASFLLRDYGFDLEDLSFTQQGNLPREVDPKLAYAEFNLMDAPVELNNADRNELLRIPGIGPRSASAIYLARRENKLQHLSQLHKLGILTERAAPYILLNGRRPPQQLRLF